MNPVAGESCVSALESQYYSEMYGPSSISLAVASARGRKLGEIRIAEQFCFCYHRVKGPYADCDPTFEFLTD